MFNIQATWDIWIWFDELHNNVVGTSWGLNEKEFQKFARGLPYLISPKWRQAATNLGQHWLKLWFAAWRHWAPTWSDADWRSILAEQANSCEDIMYH